MLHYCIALPCFLQIAMPPTGSLTDNSLKSQGFVLFHTSFALMIQNLKLEGSNFCGFCSSLPILKMNQLNKALIQISTTAWVQLKGGMAVRLVRVWLWQYWQTFLNNIFWLTNYSKPVHPLSPYILVITLNLQLMLVWPLHHLTGHRVDSHPSVRSFDNHLFVNIHHFSSALS